MVVPSSSVPLAPDVRWPAGQVMRIELQNFMCHEHLEVELASNVTFISGRNGSGKSALLTALQVCFGVRARRTGRAGAVRELVRQGCHSARVLVTLSNQGGDAFEPERYGQRVTIERRFGSGARTRLLDENGIEVAQGARAVEALVDHHAAHAGNPVVVLTQDAARSFAGDATPEERYELFAQAMRFNDTEAHLQEAQTRIDAMEDTVTSGKVELNRLAEALEERRRALEHARGAVRSREEAAVLARALAWRCCWDARADLERLRTAAEEDAPSRMVSAQGHLDTTKVALTRLRDSVASVKREIAAIIAEQDEHARTGDNVAQDLSAARRDVDHARKRLDSRCSALKLAEDRHRIAEAGRADNDDPERAEARTQAREAAERDLARLRGLAESAAADLDAAKAVCEATLAAEREMVAAAAALEEPSAAAARELTLAEQALGAARRHLEEVRRSRFDPAVAFGDDVARLAAAVASNSERFREPVFGPIGVLVRLRDSRWRRAAGAAVGHLLRSFVVRNAADMRELDRLARQIRVHARSILVQNRNRCYDLSRLGAPPAGVVTVDSMLCYPDGPDGVVLRCLMIDHAKVERCLLVESVRNLRELLGDADAMRRCGVVAAWAADGSKGYKRGSTETVLRPNSHSPNILTADDGKADYAQRVAEAETEYATAKEKVESRATAVRLRRAEDSQAAMRVGRAKADCKQADDEFHTARMRERAAMAALKQAETRLNVEREVVGDDEELQRAADALASARSDEAAAQEQLQAAMRRIAELEEQVAEARQAPDAASERRVRAEDRLQELAGEVQRVGLNNEKAEAQLARATRDAEAFRKELDKTKVAVDELQSQAERICSSEAGEASLRDSIALVRRQGNATSSTPSMDELQAALSKILRSIEQVELRAGGSPEELATRMETDEGKLHREEIQQRRLTDMLRQMRQSLRKRKRNFWRLREVVSNSVDMRFHEYIQGRGHSGSIRLDHDARRMIVSVGVNNTEKTEELRALSGGERSLVTISMLLALGHEGLRPPFHAMDEFDVFMDDANRRHAISYLLRFAHRFSDRQFIFLTPSDISVVTAVQEHLSTKQRMVFPPGFIRFVSLAAPRER